MDETCRLRRGEGYGARGDEARQEKTLALFCAGLTTSARSAGSLGDENGAFLRVRKVVWR